VNHRVIVFDATTGAYKRHWGAYGKRPDDSYFAQSGEGENKPHRYDPASPPPPQFSIVHGVRISKDGLVYVCDRTNDRLQVFRKDGTLVQEAFIAKETLGSGSVSDIGFSVDPQQQFAFVVDATNHRVFVLDRRALKILSTFGGAGHGPGQFDVAHNLAVDSKGDLFITETGEGRRVQKFVPSIQR
jgi:DNA-binding beta-propeller fold protein YncE